MFLARGSSRHVEDCALHRRYSSLRLGRAIIESSPRGFHRREFAAECDRSRVRARNLLLRNSRHGGVVHSRLIESVVHRPIEGCTGEQEHSTMSAETGSISHDCLKTADTVGWYTSVRFNQSPIIPVDAGIYPQPTVYLPISDIIDHVEPLEHPTVSAVLRDVPTDVTGTADIVGYHSTHGETISGRPSPDSEPSIGLIIF